MRGELPMLLLLAIASIAPGSASAAEKTSVVLLRTAGPVYEQAAAGFRHGRTPALDLLVDARAPGAALVGKVRAFHPDVLVAIGPDAALFAAREFDDIPRVVTLAPDTG